MDVVIAIAFGAAVIFFVGCFYLFSADHSNRRAMIWAAVLTGILLGSAVFVFVAFIIKDL
jgi:ABC-type lipoprotein release transport system permease subunit